MRSTSSRERSSTESRWRRSSDGGRRSPPTTRRSVIGFALLALLDEDDLIDLVDLHQLDLNALVPRGRQVLADVVGANRQLAVAAVGEDGELHAIRPPVLEERVDRGADRPARIEDVVDEDDGAALEVEVELRLAGERLRPARRMAGAHVHVVAVEGDVELAEGELVARPLLDESAEPLRDRNAAGVDADERHGVELLVPLDDLVRDAGKRAPDRFVIQQDFPRRCDGRVRHSTPFRPLWTGLKGRYGPHSSRSDRTARLDSPGASSKVLSVVDDLLRRYARLIVEVGANVQPGQVIWVVAEPRAAPLVRLVAEAAYERGAKFVDPWYFDPFVKRARLEHADPETLDYVPPWYGSRLRELGEGHGVRISITPQVPPGLLDGIDPERAGRDALPAHKENFDVINARTTNWTVVPWPVPEWARLVHPGLDEDAAMEKLWEQLVYVLRLDEPDAAAAWQARLRELHDAGTRLNEQRFDAVRFEGPGTDLTIGLLPTSRFGSETPGMQTVDGVIHAPNLPTEEVTTTPDPLRADGVVTATKPLDVSGTVVRDLRIRFEGGRAVEIEGENADVLRARVAKDE